MPAGVWLAAAVKIGVGLRHGDGKGLDRFHLIRSAFKKDWPHNDRGAVWLRDIGRFRRSIGRFRRSIGRLRSISSFRGIRRFRGICWFRGINRLRGICRFRMIVWSYF